MFDSLFSRLVDARLRKLQGGHITLIDGDQQWCYGNDDAELSVTILVHHPRWYRRIALGGGIGAAEALADGDWTCSDLTALVRIMIRNLPAGDTANGPLTRIRHAAEQLGHWMRRNTVVNARQNIIRHYDLSNEFFALFLDHSMTYSAAIFPHREASLLDGSMEKIDRACRKLNLRPSDHLLEIGTGWGSLAIHAAERYGCHVTTTTISDEQYAFARRRIDDAGLTGQITLLHQDYRNLTGQYDKLVSIEMIEAVGHHYFDAFFRQCGALLKPDGQLLIQAITIVDHRYEHHRRTVDFIKRFIFPGGCLPSVAALLNSMAKTSRLRLVHLEEFSAHYAETLARWRKRFLDHLDDVRQLGFDERFIRIWEYYFCYCQAAFLERHVNVSQLWMAGPAAIVSPVDQSFQTAGSTPDPQPPAANPEGVFVESPAR